MTIMEVMFWCMLLVLGFAGSALYSGMETGSYTLNRVRLQILDHQRDGAARTLRRLLNRQTLLLSTLLIGNNIMNYMGTASLAVLLEGWGLTELQTIIANTLIVTPILFVFGETLPKDLFNAYSDRLMYRLAPVLVGSQRLFTWMGILPLVHGVTWLVFRFMGEPHGTPVFHPRRQVEVLVREGVGHGLLSDEQSAIVARVLMLTGRRVSQEMVPWEQVITLALHDEGNAVRELAERTSRSRFPVVDETGRVTGFVDVIDALLHDEVDLPSVSHLQKPVLTLPASTPLREALTLLQRRKEAFAVVTDRGHPVGVVTIKDVVEPITGELASW